MLGVLKELHSLKIDLLKYLFGMLTSSPASNVFWGIVDEGHHTLRIIIGLKNFQTFFFLTDCDAYYAFKGVSLIFICKDRFQFLFKFIVSNKGVFPEIHGYIYLGVEMLLIQILSLFPEHVGLFFFVLE